MSLRRSINWNAAMRDMHNERSPEKRLKTEMLAALKASLPILREEAELRASAGIPDYVDPAQKALTLVEAAIKKAEGAQP